MNRVKDTQPGKRVPLVLVGNKVDLADERQVPREVAIGLSRSWNGVPYYECSARKEINITEVRLDRTMAQSREGSRRR